jgi:glycosyltransferase involved in cell wall biosynthesis
MPARRPSLVVVQSAVTQFDGPFFRFLDACGPFRLTVYYTKARDAVRPYDPEIRRHPDWNCDALSGYSFHIYPPGLLGRIKTSFSVVGKRPDLIIVSGWRSLDYLLVLLFARLAGVPLGLRADNCSTAVGKRGARAFVRRQLLRLFSTGHPVGSLAETHMIESGIGRQRIFPFPYLVDQEFLTSAYARVLPCRDSLRSEYGIGPSDFVVLGVMKFIDREDPMTLLKAFTFVCRGPDEEIPKLHLILVGDGDLRPAIERYLTEEHLSNVQLPGYVSYKALPSFFALADILVHPARIESWGVTVNEALVCGLPVLAASSVGAAADLIEPGVNGFTFPAGDWRALALLIQKLRLQPALLADLKARCGKPAALARFSYVSTRDNLSQALSFVSGH